MVADSTILPLRLDGTAHAFPGDNKVRAKVVHAGEFNVVDVSGIDPEISRENPAPRMKTSRGHTLISEMLRGRPREAWQ